MLPEEEFGSFVLVQEVFLIVSGLATAFALQPLLKFASEERVETAGVITVSLVLHTAFLLVASLLLVAVRPLAVRLLNAQSLSVLWNYIPVMLAASFARNFTLMLLQSRFRVREVFWIDAAHFLGAPLLMWGMSRLHRFNSAEDLILVTIVSLSASSILGLVFAWSMIRVTLRPSRTEYAQMWDYGKFALGGIASYLVYSKADTFILAGFTGPVQVAVYNSVKVFTRVYEMVGQVVQMFVLPAVSMLSSRGEAASLRAVVEKSILFITVALLPVTLVFVVAPSLLLDVLYQGRYATAAPLLRIFGSLSLVVPLYAVCTNALMGLGKAKEGFLLGLAMFAVSCGVYFVFTPLLGSAGAALGFVVASFIMGWISARVAARYIPFTASGVLRRIGDIRMFLTTNARKYFSR